MIEWAHTHVGGALMGGWEGCHHLGHVHQQLLHELLVRFLRRMMLSGGRLAACVPHGYVGYIEGNEQVEGDREAAVPSERLFLSWPTAERRYGVVAAEVALITQYDAQPLARQPLHRRCLRSHHAV